MTCSREQLIYAAIMIVLMGGCGQNQQKEKDLFKHQPDTDVTSLPEYNFQSFSGTLWKTKVKVAVAAIKAPKDGNYYSLLAPENYDPSHVKYNPPFELEKIITELPVGTVLRIEHLMKDNGNWGGVRVTASLVGVNSSTTEYGKTVYLSQFLLEKNLFVWPAWSKSTNWAGASDMMEIVK